MLSKGAIVSGVTCWPGSVTRLPYVLFTSRIHQYRPQITLQKETPWKRVCFGVAGSTGHLH